MGIRPPPKTFYPNKGPWKAQGLGNFKEKHTINQNSDKPQCTGILLIIMTKQVRKAEARISRLQTTVDKSSDKNLSKQTYKNKSLGQAI